MNAVAESPAKPKPPVRHAPPPYVKPLIARPLTYRRHFRHAGRKITAELHEDKIVFHPYGGRRRVEYTFAQLWATGMGELL